MSRSLAIKNPSLLLALAYAAPLAVHAVAIALIHFLVPAVSSTAAGNLLSTTSLFGSLAIGTYCASRLRTGSLLTQVLWLAGYLASLVVVLAVSSAAIGCLFGECSA